MEGRGGGLRGFGVVVFREGVFAGVLRIGVYRGYYFVVVSKSIVVFWGFVSFVYSLLLFFDSEV